MNYFAEDQRWQARGIKMPSSGLRELEPVSRGLTRDHGKKPGSKGQTSAVFRQGH